MAVPIYHANTPLAGPGRSADDAAAQVADAVVVPAPRVAANVAAPTLRRWRRKRASQRRKVRQRAAPVEVNTDPGQERPQDDLVKKGVPLGTLARESSAAGVSLDQMLVVPYQSNPDAFVGGMNRLRAGQVRRCHRPPAPLVSPAAEARGDRGGQPGISTKSQPRLPAGPGRRWSAKALILLSQQSAGGKPVRWRSRPGPPVKPGQSRKRRARTR